MANPFDPEYYPISVPSRIVKGSHTGWKILDTTDLTGSTLKVRFREVGGIDIVEISGAVTAVDGVDYHVFEVVASATSFDGYTDNLECRYDLVQVQTSDSNEAIIATGFTRIFGSDADRRSHAEVMLAKIKSVLEGRADNDIDSYSIAGRSLSRIPLSELRAHRDYYMGEVRRTGGTIEGEQVRKKRNTVITRFI
jgi:hypothetical protein